MVYSLPKNLLIVFAFVGDSTMTSLRIVEACNVTPKSVLRGERYVAQRTVVKFSVLN